MKNERPALAHVIARLVRDAAPVAPLPPPLRRAGRWGTRALIAAALAVLLLGLRPDMRERIADARFLISGLVLLAMALASTIGAFALSVPGAAWPRAARALPLLGTIAWGGMLGWMLAATGTPLELLSTTPLHPSCIVRIMAIAMLPGLAILAMLRQAAPLDLRWTGALAALACVALGALGTQFVCYDDSPAHHLLWHFTPVVLLTLGGMALGARLFDRRPVHDTSHPRRGERPN